MALDNPSEGPHHVSSGSKDPECGRKLSKIQLIILLNQVRKNVFHINRGNHKYRHGCIPFNNLITKTKKQYFYWFPGSRIEDRGSRIEDRGSRIEDRGSRIKDQGSRIGDQELRIHQKLN